jgi:hypothetical protein
MDPTPNDHVLAFLRGFIRAQRRDRWLYLFEHDRSKLERNSHHLISDIEPRHVTDDLHLCGIPDHRIVGAFYDMSRGELGWRCPIEIMEREPHFDAIFSIEPGKLAALLFHEKKRYVVRA